MSETIRRDYITIGDLSGKQREYAVEALFEMEGKKKYALLRNEEEMLLMQVKEEDGAQVLVGLEDPEEAESILSAYQIAVEASPAEK
jgi:hypothetical protein